MWCNYSYHKKVETRLLIWYTARTDMIITFHGGQTVRFQTGESIILANPSQAPAGIRQTSMGSHIVLCSSFSHEHHFTDAVRGSTESETFIIDGPGSYEYLETSISGVPLGVGNTDAELAAVYDFTMDDMRVAVLGSTVSKDIINPEVSEVCSEVDILVLPVTAETLHEAAAMVSFFDPHVVIPTGYWKSDEPTLRKFLADVGTQHEQLEKLTVKRRDIEGVSKKLITFSL